MIDARSFMEFCEKELNVKFVLAGTDKRALDVFAERDEEIVVAQSTNSITGHSKEAAMQLEICSFINTHPDWEAILAKDPYRYTR
jgi:tryptophan synthase alpha subunit